MISHRAKTNDEKIIEVLFESNSKLDFLISKVNSIESKLSPDVRYKQLLETFLSEIDLEEMSDEEIFDEATKKINEFKEYSKNKHQPLNDDIFDEKFNSFIKEGKIIEARNLLKNQHLYIKNNSAKRAYHLGELSYYLFDYNEAEKYFCEAVKYDASNIQYLKKAASIKNLLSKYMEGLNFYNTALQILKLKNNNIIEISHLLSDIGLTHEKLGNYDKALELYEESNKLTEQEIGENNKHYIATLNNIAQLYTLQGKLNEAANFYIQVVQYDLKQYGPTHKILASDYNNIAGVLLNSRKYKDALNFFNLAYKIYGDKSKIKHFRLGIISMNIAICLSGLGEINQAEDKYDEAEKILLAAFGEEHDDVGFVRFNKACFLFDNGQRDKAIKTMEQALSSYISSVGNFHKDTKAAKIELRKMKATTS